MGEGGKENGGKGEGARSEVSQYIKEWTLGRKEERMGLCGNDEVETSFLFFAPPSTLLE